MLIATFGPTTGWVGKRITFENERFILEGHGLITAADTLTYDRQGHLSWAYAGLQEWVQKVAAANAVTAPQAQPSVARPAARVETAPQVVARAARAHRSKLSFGGRGGECAAVSVGDHIVGLCPDGTAVVAGKRNMYGRNSVDSWRDLVGMSAGFYHTVGLRADGTAEAVGGNDSWYFDDGLMDVSSWRDLVAVSAGDDRTVALRADGTAIAAGVTKYVADKIGSWSGLVAVSAGCRTALALRADGTAAAVGLDRYGAAEVSSWRDLVAVSAGRYMVGLRADGTVLVVGGTEIGKSDLSTWVLAVPRSDETRVWVGADLRTLDAVPECRAQPTEQAETAPPTEHEMQTLLGALKSGGTPAERIAAARALGKIGDPRAVEPLGIVLSDDRHLCANGMRENSPGVHKAAAQALAKIGGPRAVELLGVSLRREHNLNAGDDAEALGRIGSPAAEEQLRTAGDLEDSYGWVRSDVVKALGKIRGRRAAEARRAARTRRQDLNS